MKRMSMIVFFLLILFSLRSPAYSHSGGTDSNGGHTNHSTGEYHYHHGYPAHDHYDMDGDGDIDCPYDFLDNTGNNSNSSRSSNSGSSYPLPSINLPELILPTLAPAATLSPRPIATPKTIEKEATDVPLWPVRIIVILSLAVLFLLVQNRVKTVDFQKQKATYEKKLKDNNLRHQQEIESQKHQYEEHLKNDVAQVEQDLCIITNAMHRTLGDQYLYRLAGASNGEILDSDNLPSDAYTKTDLWGPKYTLYTSASNRVPIRYHDSWCRYANRSFPINAHTINLHPRRYAPCSICCPKLPDTTWVTRYLLYKSIIEKHQADST